MFNSVISGSNAPYTKAEVNTLLNAKQETITGAAITIATSDLTASRAVISKAGGKITVSPVSDTELSYLSGATSSIQTQLNAKQATITGGATTIATSNLIANRALISDASGKVAVSSTITTTELGYLDGVSSGIQTQFSAITAYGDTSYGFVSTKYAGYVNSA